MSLGKSDPAPLDATALKAYAHPLRLQIIRYLNDHGAATATQLARHLGESTGQTSYHLRQLARHGLVEDDPGRGTGRERWWRPRSFRADATVLRDDPDGLPAARTMLAGVAAARAETLEDWFRRGITAPEEWVAASMHNQATLLLTPDEAAALNAEILEVIDRHGHRSDQARSGAIPEGMARVRVYVDTFPLPEGPPDTEAGTA